MPIEGPERPVSPQDNVDSRPGSGGGEPRFSHALTVSAPAPNIWRNLPPEIVQSIGRHLLDDAIGSGSVELESDGASALPGTTEAGRDLRNLSMTSRTNYRFIKPMAAVMTAMSIEELPEARRAAKFDEMLRYVAQQPAVADAQERAKGLAALASRLCAFSANDSRQRARFGATLSAAIDLPDKHRAAVLAQLAQAVSTLDQHARRGAFDAVMDATRRLAPEHLQVDVLIGFAADIEYFPLEDGLMKLYSFNAILAEMDALADDHHEWVFCALIACAGHLGEADRQPQSMAELVAVEPSGAYARFSGPVHDRYEACVALLQRVSHLAPHSKPNRLAAATGLILEFPDNPSWSGELFGAVLGDAFTVPAVDQFRVLVPLARTTHCVPVQDQPTWYMAVSDTCIKIEEALAEESGAVLQQTLRVHENLQFAFERMAATAQVEIQRRLDERLQLIIEQPPT